MKHSHSEGTPQRHARILVTKRAVPRTVAMVFAVSVMLPLPVNASPVVPLLPLLPVWASAAPPLGPRALQSQDGHEVGDSTPWLKKLRKGEVMLHAWGTIINDRLLSKMLLVGPAPDVSEHVGQRAEGHAITSADADGSERYRVFRDGKLAAIDVPPGLHPKRTRMTLKLVMTSSRGTFQRANLTAEVIAEAMSTSEECAERVTQRLVEAVQESHGVKLRGSTKTVDGRTRISVKAPGGETWDVASGVLVVSPGHEPFLALRNAFIAPEFAALALQAPDQIMRSARVLFGEDGHSTQPITFAKGARIQITFTAHLKKRGMVSATTIYTEKSTKLKTRIERACKELRSAIRDQAGVSLTCKYNSQSQEIHVEPPRKDAWLPAVDFDIEYRWYNPPKTP